MSTKPCPECTAPLKVDATKCACGWRTIPKATASSKSADTKDTEPWRCSHELLGQRCPDAGTHKRGDRWLCAFHAGKRGLTDTISADAVRDGVARARAVLAKAKPLKRVGEMRPLAEFLPTPTEVAAARERFDDPAGDLWPAGRE